MKPIIIFKEKNKNNKLEFTEEELTKLLEKAYNQGYEDGKPSLSYLPGREKFLTITPTPSTIASEIKTIQCPYCYSKNVQYMYGTATLLTHNNQMSCHYVCNECHKEFDV